MANASAAAVAVRAIPRRADAVVLGAGIAGVAAAYHLLRYHGLTSVVLADPRPPLCGTSARSTECYRTFFETPALVAFMARSVLGLEAHARESGNAFRMSRRGYLFVSSRGAAGAAELRRAAANASAWGAGPLREHRGGAAAATYAHNRPGQLDGTDWIPATGDGFDLLEGRQLVQAHFPFLAATVDVALHARCAGWVNAHVYGSYFLEGARSRGATLVRAAASGVALEGDRVVGVRLASAEDGGEALVSTPVVVNATGPFLQATQRALDPQDRGRADLRIFNEPHGKISFRLPATVPGADLLTSTAPMVICSDELALPWTDDERAALAEAAEQATTTWSRAYLRALGGRLPSGLHFRPYGRDAILALWEFAHVDTPAPDPPTYELDHLWEPTYAEVVQRGLAELVPALRTAVGATRVTVNGGLYCKTHDNHPLIGPHGPAGVYLCGGLRGVGIMGAEVWPPLRTQ